MSAAKMVMGAAGLALAGLQVRGLVKHFGGVQAVKGVDFDVAPGECVALIGPNGAGKSTCFACIAGQQAPTRGEVVWNRQRIDTWRAPQRLRAGVARAARTTTEQGARRRGCPKERERRRDVSRPWTGCWESASRTRGMVKAKAITKTTINAVATSGVAVIGCT